MKRYFFAIFALLIFGSAVATVVVFAKGKPEWVTVGKAEKVTGNKFKVGQDDIELDDDTKVVGQGKIKNNVKVAVIGDEATESGKPKKAVKIYVSTATSSAPLKRHAVHGVITNIAGSVLTIAHEVHRERTYMVSFDATTVVKSKNNLVTSADLAVGERVIAIGAPTADGLLAKTIMIIPGSARGIYEKQPVATPSASPEPSPSPTATPSASPSPEPSPTPTATPSVTPTPAP